MKNKNIKKKIYKSVKNRYLKKVTKNLGNIEILDDKIICYVSNKVIKNKFKKNTYYIGFDGVYNISEDYIKLNSLFDINKPIYYIIENMNFVDGIELHTNFDSHVIFRNCVFNKNIAILWGNEVIFENNIYNDYCPVYYYGNCFLNGNVKSLKIINDNFVNSSSSHHPTKFGINITVDEFELNNSNISIDCPSNIIIDAKNTTIINSKVNSPEIYLKSDNITTTNSSIYSSNGIIIENKNCSVIDGLSTTTLVYNGIDLSDDKSQFSKISKDLIEMKKSRIDFVEKLRNLLNCCSHVNDKEVIDLIQIQNNKCIQKVLKKDD